MKHFYRNGNRVEVHDHPTGQIALEVLPDGRKRMLFNPIIDLLTGQVYETGEEYMRARALESAARQSVTV